jgi:hypothetical protein
MMRGLDRLRGADGKYVYAVFYVALHRRRKDHRGGYRRVTDWLACTSQLTAWGRTQQDAYRNLVELHRLSPMGDKCDLSTAVDKTEKVPLLTEVRA